MNESELLMMIIELQSNVRDSIVLFFTGFSGFCMVGYLVGNRLDRYMTASLIGAYTIFTITNSLAIMTSVAE